jgi:signal transduction histidine kinase
MRLGGGGLNIALEGKWNRLDKEATSQLYSIISEAVANAIRQAKATEITFECRHEPLSTTICVENDGEPFPDRLQEGMGLPLMRYRAMSIGGNLIIEGGTGQRTRVICTVPHKAAADEKAFPRSGQRLNTTA